MSESFALRRDEEASGAADKVRGSNQAGLRAHNERAVLSLIRRNGALAKADIARRTGLSPQTASVIMRALEAEKLVLRAEPRRGRVGQPSVPMRLNPDGAYAFGLKIGRRSLDIVLMDFVGTVRGRRSRSVPYPTPEGVCDFLAEALEALSDTLPPEARERVAGIGVGMPFQLWDWAAECGAPPGAMDGWRGFDVPAALSARTGLSVHVANDATAACGAEHAFGGEEGTDFVYFFVGSFIGGGIVIDDALVVGRDNNAGALGSMPVPRRDRPGAEQLIAVASLHLLEAAAEASGLTWSGMRDPDFHWTELGTLLDSWIEEAARGIAHAVASACAVYDFEAAVIDGAFPPFVRERLVEAVRAGLSRIDAQGLSPVAVRPGTIGAQAREIGAASLPFFAKFLLDHRVLYAERS